MNNTDKNKKRNWFREPKKRLELNYGLKEYFKIFEIDRMVTSEVCIPIKTIWENEITLHCFTLFTSKYQS